MGTVGLLKILLIGLALLFLGIYSGDPIQMGTGGEGISDDRRIYGNEFRKPRPGIKIESIGGPEIMPGM